VARRSTPPLRRGVWCDVTADCLFIVGRRSVVTAVENCRTCASSSSEQLSNRGSGDVGAGLVVRLCGGAGEAAFSEHEPLVSSKKSVEVSAESGGNSSEMLPSWPSVSLLGPPAASAADLGTPGVVVGPEGAGGVA